MPNAKILEMFLTSQRERATGWLCCTCNGYTSRLGFSDGRLVQLDARFGFQSRVPALARLGLLSWRKVDGLWARGEADGNDAEALAEAETNAAAAEEASVLATCCNILRLAQSADFQPAAMDGTELVPAKRLTEAVGESARP
jgi:hypothetical protein